MGVVKPMEKIYIAGHRGMVGSAIVRQLLAQGIEADQIVTRTGLQHIGVVAAV